MRHLSYAFPLKLKQNVWNKTVYTMEDAALVNFPPISSLHRASHANAQPFVFPEKDIGVMKTLNLQKPVPQPFEVAKIDDAFSSCVGHVTLISAAMQEYSLMFGLASLNHTAPGPTRKRTMTTTSRGRQRKLELNVVDDGKDDDEVTE